jgi:hypothetical protein
MKKIYFKFIAVFILFGFSSLVAQVPTWQSAFSAGYNGNESVSAVAVGCIWQQLYNRFIHFFVHQFWNVFITK